MSQYPQFITLFSRDHDLISRVKPLLEETFKLQTVGTYYEFSRLMDRIGPGVILMDIRLPTDAPDLELFPEEFPHHIFIVLGNLSSSPMLHPTVPKMYAAMGLTSEVHTICRQVKKAQEFFEIKEENRQLQQEIAHSKTPPNTEVPTTRLDNLFSIRELIRIMRSMDNVEALPERLLEELSGVMHLSRAGIALKKFKEDSYKICAGWMLSPESRRYEFGAQDNFVRWFESHPHVITRSTIERNNFSGEKMMLSRVLDHLSAEVLVPLRGRNGLIGWFFCNHPLNGLPFEQENLDQLILISDLMAVSLERALLFQEVQLQKNLAETLINALPIGIIYVDANNIIRLYSPSTQAIFGGPNPDKTGEPLHTLGPQLREISNTLISSHALNPVSREWQDPTNGRPLRATAIAIRNKENYSGILMTIEDRTQENAMQDKQDHLERGLFWNQLAASISHEVRNPLVTIKTFAQLLPERYQDPEFRSEFSELVDLDINRLSAMIDQLNDFANPGDISLVKIDALKALKYARAQFEKTPPSKPLPKIIEDIESIIPEVLADLDALSKSIEMLLQNAAEALEGKPGTIHLSLNKGVDVEYGETVEIGISDDGPGILDELRDHVFSPFCSHKPRGLGLGLPIAQRTMADHNGKIDLQSSPRGTRVRLILPAYRV